MMLLRIAESVIVLSSEEVEYFAALERSQYMVALGLQSMSRDLGFEVNVEYSY